MRLDDSVELVELVELVEAVPPFPPIPPVPRNRPGLVKGRFENE